MTKKCLILIGLIGVIFFGVTGVATIREIKNFSNRSASTKHFLSEDPFYKQYTQDVDPHEIGLKTYHCPFSDCVATLNDRVMYFGSKNSLRAPVTGALTRCLAIGLFPVSVVTDGTVSILHAGWEGCFSWKSSEHQERMWYYLGRSKKCLYGLLASPVGLIYPDLVTQHFIHSPPKLTVQPYGKLYSSSGLELFPKTGMDVQKMILQAKKEGRKVAFAGALMSQGRQALPPSEGDLILNFSKMNRVEIDPVNKTARVGPGTTWADLQRASNEHALAVKVMQASNVFSVGGSVSVNCHGWDHQSGTLKETIRSLTLVDADGHFQTLTPSDDFFHYVVGGMGAFGAIVEVELDLTDNSPLTARGEIVSPQEYIAYFYDQILPSEDVNLHYYRLSLDPKDLFQTGVAVSYVKNRDQGVISNLRDEPQRGYKADRIELQIVRRLNWIQKGAWKLEKKNALITSPTSRNEAMRPPIKAIFNDSQYDAEWLQEYFISGEELPAFLKFLSKILMENEVAVFNASVRYVKENPSSGFSYSPKSDMFAVVLFFNQSLKPEKIEKTRRWVGEVIDYLNEHGGIYYLPYQHFASYDQFQKSYTNWQSVLTKKRQVDPGEVFMSGFLDEYFHDNLIADHKPDSILSKVMDPELGQWDSIKDFIDVIFMQLDSGKFQDMMMSIVKERNQSDEAIYRAMYERIGQASPGMIQKLRLGLRSLSALQNDLSDQVVQLIGDQPVHGYVEIGYPGRMVRPLKQKLCLDGDIYVVNEKETLMDYVESGFPRPYKTFVPLSNYDPIRADHIPSESVDLVTCFIGLHHIPPEKLKPFVRSISRVLKPGGHFILMDHDAYNDGLKDFVSVVHSIFNAGTGVAPEEEKAEVRHFNSLDYWTDIVEEEGLVRGSEEPLIRVGDPTLNSLIRFTKNPQEAVTLPPEYHRELLATYLTAPEWFNVRSANSYAQFIKHTPFFFFPFFDEIGRFWTIYSDSWNAARKHYSFWELATSEFNVMNLFIGTTMTIEYTAKGILSMPIRWYYGGEWGEAQRIHMLVDAKGVDLSSIDPKIQVHDSIGEFVHIETPRYFPFLEVTQNLAGNGVEFIELAGQKLIHIDVSVDRETAVDLPDGCRFLYSSKFFDDPERKQWALEVEVGHLSQVLRFCLKNDLNVVYIHDY